MDKDRARELKRSGRGRFAGAGAVAPAAKRQQRSSSGHINSNNSPPSSAPNNSSDGTGQVDAMDGLMKERASGVRWSSGNHEEGGGDSGGESGEFDPSMFRAATVAASLTSRKRVRLQGKVSDDCNPVDPAVVPRRLRSAVNKRSHQSASPPSPDSKKKPRLAPNGTQLPLVNGARGFKQSMLLEPITKDEEEVAETLSALATMIPVHQVSEAESEMKATSVSLSEASKQGGTKFLLPCAGAEALNPSRVEELPEETMMVDPSVKEQPTVLIGSQKFDLELSRTAQSDFQRTPTSKNEQVESTCLRDAMKSSNPSGASIQLYSRNGVLQRTQFNALPACKPEIELWKFGSISVEKELHSVKQKPDGGAHNMCRKETTPDVRRGVPSNGYGNSAMPSSSKAAVQPDSVTGADRPSSTGNYLPTEKLPSISADRKRKRCTTHVYISHLIRNHQNTEKNARLPCPSNQLKVKEGRNSGVQTSSETAGSRNGPNSITSAGANGTILERNTHEARIRMLHDGRLLQVQPASMLPGTYAQQKPVCDFLSLSATGETSSPGNAVKSSGQLHIPYLHSQAPHHSMMPFPFPHGPYTSPYSDQLAAAASQQVQLQMPHYMGNPFYGQHMVHAGGGSTKQQLQQQQQQQQMWQAQMANYRLPLGSMGSSSSLLSSAQPPSIFPPPSEMLGGAYHPCNLLQQEQQLQSIPSSSSSRAKRQHQHHDAGRFGSEGPAQLQLLCNTQHM